MSIEKTKEQIAAMPKGEIQVKGFGLAPMPIHPVHAEAYKRLGYETDLNPPLTVANVQELADSHTALLEAAKDALRSMPATYFNYNAIKALGRAIQQAEGD
jgi:hypothetical protein